MWPLPFFSVVLQTWGVARCTLKIRWGESLCNQLHLQSYISQQLDEGAVVMFPGIERRESDFTKRVARLATKFESVSVSPEYSPGEGILWDLANDKRVRRWGWGVERSMGQGWVVQWRRMEWRIDVASRKKKELWCFTQDWRLWASSPSEQRSGNIYSQRGWNISAKRLVSKQTKKGIRGECFKARKHTFIVLTESKAILRLPKSRIISRTKQHLNYGQLVCSVCDKIRFFLCTKYLMRRREGLY
jgi:hypothetical protein